MQFDIELAYKFVATTAERKSGRDATMLELVALSAVLLCGAASIVMLQRWRWRKRRLAGAAAHRKRTSYAAAGIRSHPLACAAVRKYYGRRFLAEDAPALPVDGCTVRRCPCRYEHFADRREDERRVRFAIRDVFRDAAGIDRRRGDRRHPRAST